VNRFSLEEMPLVTALTFQILRELPMAAAMECIQSEDRKWLVFCGFGHVCAE